VMVQQQDDVQAVIASGLMAPERVVTTGFGRLADGTRVEVTSAEEAGPIPADPAQRPSRPGGGAPKGKGQRQQGAADAPGTGRLGQAAADPSPPSQRRGGGGAPNGQEQPAPGAGGSPSAAP
ncbi:MAG TPA: efflux RND transporter periplasmic adaptor subunit, partial [Xanthobacteraceae bacterium]